MSYYGFYQSSTPSINNPLMLTPSLEEEARLLAMKMDPNLNGVAEPEDCSPPVSQQFSEVFLFYFKIDIYNHIFSSVSHHYYLGSLIFL